MLQSIFGMSHHLGMLQSYQIGNSNRLMQLGKRLLSEGSKMRKQPLEDLLIYDYGMRGEKRGCANNAIADDCL